MKKIAALLAWLGVLLVAVAVFANDGVAVLSPAGKSLLREISSLDLMQVQLGQLANDKGTSQDVKEFGARMVEDHSTSNQELRTIAAQKNLKLPSQVERKHAAIIARLTKLSGIDFDRSYVDAIVTNGIKSISRLKKALENHADPDLVSWSSGRLPVLQEQLQLAVQLAQKLRRR